MIYFFRRMLHKFKNRNITAKEKTQEIIDMALTDISYNWRAFSKEDVGPLVYRFPIDYASKLSKNEFYDLFLQHFGKFCVEKQKDFNNLEQTKWKIQGTTL